MESLEQRSALKYKLLFHVLHFKEPLPLFVTNKRDDFRTFYYLCVIDVEYRKSCVSSVNVL